MNCAVSIAEKPQIGIPFQPGNNANPAGRPKGSRNKLGEAFIAALHDDFKINGIAVIAKVRDERPHEYLKVVASLLPKQVEIKESAFDGLSDEDIAVLISLAGSALPVSDEGAIGTDIAGKPQSAEILPPVPEAG